MKGGKRSATRAVEMILKRMDWRELHAIVSGSDLGSRMRNLLLGMRAQDDLGLESELVQTRGVGNAKARAVSETTGPKRCIALPNITGDWIEFGRAAGVKMRNETDSMGRERREIARDGRETEDFRIAGGEGAE